MSYRRTARAPSFPQSPAGDEAERLMRDAMREAKHTPRTHAVSESDRPSVLLSLRDDGGLQVEIRGEALRRTIALHADPQRAMETIYRILGGQANAQRAIGLDGAPTQAQVKQWARMAVARDGVEVWTVAPRAKLASGTSKTAEELGL